jgi:hypothetical protein
MIQAQGDDDKGTSKKGDGATPAHEHAQEAPKTDATDTSPNANAVALRWPLPPSAIHDGLLFRKVG